MDFYNSIQGFNKGKYKDYINKNLISKQFTIIILIKY